MSARGVVGSTPKNAYFKIDFSEDGVFEIIDYTHLPKYLHKAGHKALWKDMRSGKFLLRRRHENKTERVQDK